MKYFLFSFLMTILAFTEMQGQRIKVEDNQRQKEFEVYGFCLDQGATMLSIPIYNAMQQDIKIKLVSVEFFGNPNTNLATAELVSVNETDNSIEEITDVLVGDLGYIPFDYEADLKLTFPVGINSFPFYMGPSTDPGMSDHGVRVRVKLLIYEYDSITETWVLEDPDYYTSILQIRKCKNDPNQQRLSQEEVVENNESQVNLSDIKVSPNPVVDKTSINFKTTDVSDLSIHVFDSMGKQIKTIQHTSIGGNEQVEFDCTEIPKGIYIINIISGDEKYVEKFIKI